MPYVSPGQGGEQEEYVDFKKSRKGDRVKVAQAWVAHFPTLCKVCVAGLGAARGVACVQ